MSFDDCIAEAPIGTIWSSPPWRMSVTAGADDSPQTSRQMCRVLAMRRLFECVHVDGTIERCRPHARLGDLDGAHAVLERCGRLDARVHEPDEALERRPHGLGRGR